MHRRDLNTHTLRRKRLHILHERAGDLLVVLISHKTAGYFRKRLTRQHSLGALTRITAPDAADIKRRTAGVALKCRITGFAEDLIHADRSVVFLLVKRYLSNHRTLFFGNRQHVVIEARNGDLSILVHHFRQHLAESINRVLDSTAEMTGMQVSIRAVHLYLPVRQATQTRRYRRRLFADHRSVGNQDDICFQQLLMFL